MTGTKNIIKMKTLLNLELKTYNIPVKNIKISDVHMKYTDTFEEYDELLTKNVVFIELFDASANNTVLECIVRGTPIIINNVGGIYEYLGKNYPLYFENLEDIDSLLTYDKIFNAYHYMKTLKILSMSDFCKQIINIGF